MKDKKENKIEVGDRVKLLSMPGSCVDYYGYKLTVGNVYEVLDFDGSNVITTSDQPGQRASYNRERVEKVDAPDMTSAQMGYL